MTQLAQVIAAWGQPDFEDVLKEAIGRLGSELPLQAGLSSGSYALEKPLEVLAISSCEKPDCIEAMVGIFYESLTPGCAGDPTVESENTEHITVLVTINKQTADATFQLLEDE